MLTVRAKPVIDPSLTVAFTGHRADSLPWGFDAGSPRCIDFRARLRQSVTDLYREGKRVFLSGMASGVDTIAAEEVLALRPELADIRLICVFPYPMRDEVTLRIASEADGSFAVCDEYCAGCMQLRNRFLVENASCLIAGYDGRLTGGTYRTVLLAKEKGLPVRFIRP